MRRKALKSIISLALVGFILMPNVSAMALEVKETLQSNIELNNENLENGELESGNVDGDELVKPDGETVESEGQTVESENNIDENETVKPEVETDQKTEEIRVDEKNEVETEEVINSVDLGIKVGENYELAQKPQTYSSQQGGLTEAELERQDVKEKLQVMSEAKYLVPKTSSNYEIVMSNGDGSYSYVGEAETIEQAKGQIENIPMPASDIGALPAIINNEGQVVYSTNSMYKMPQTSGNIDLYSDPALRNAFTYVNSGYVEDAPIIEENDIGYKIEISGFTGWISKAVGAQVVPMNQVKNPSYYMSVGGVLKHFISYDLTGTKGHTLTIGPAPSYLRDGVKYFSYDGNYFYDGSDMISALNTLTSDLKNGNHNNSVNVSNPYYLYFNYLPFRSVTGYSADELNMFINNNTDAGSKLRGIGQALIDAQRLYGVNALLTLGVAINESGWGMSSISQSKNNLFGIKAFDSSPGLSADAFNTPGDSVLEFTKNYISRGYADPADWRYRGGFLGNKYRGANIKYASDPFWGEKAAQWAHKIDFELSSSNIHGLRDQNAYQLAIYKSNNQVKNGDGTLLYNVVNDLNQYAGYNDTTLILTTTEAVWQNGATCYQMYPERNTPVNGGGTANMFAGNYSWNDKGYVNVDGISLINSPANPILPYDPSYVSSWKQTSNGKVFFYDNNSRLYKGWLNLSGTYYFMDRVTGERLTGWVFDGGKWYYLYEDGKMATGIISINGQTYYLDGSGAMQSGGWTNLNGVWYYFQSNGMASKGWLVINGNWYYFNENGTMATGIIEVAGRVYHLDSNGAMRANTWISTSNGWYYVDGSGGSVVGWGYIAGAWYYFNSNGVMATGTIEVDGRVYHLGGNGVMHSNGWLSTSSGWYYLESNGASVTGWRQVGGNWYYFNSNGVMATGWVEVDGQHYYLNGSGAMLTSWISTESGWYYLEGSGAMSKGWKFINGSWYYLNEQSGVMATGLIEVNEKKYYLEASGNMITDWKQIGQDWYYFQGDGSGVKSNWLNNNFYYYFNENSIMLTGWQVIGNRKYYLYPENGRRAQNVTIDGIYLGDDGVSI